MEGKKISFGFTKTRRAADTRLAAPVQPHAEDERREYIECVEGKSIKVVGGDVVEEVKPLVIPLKPNTLATAERLEQIAAEVESALRDEPESQDKNGDGFAEAPKPEETLEQQAARELLQEARRERTAEPATLTVPMPALPPLLGEKESTLEDYESIPVGDFGMAMLRGMGWTPGKQSQYAQPTLRPKGLGLGADKLVKADKADKGQKGAREEGEEELKLQKGSLVRVLAGKHAGMYGKVVSLDEESGRALLEPAVKGSSVSVSEHTLQPVTRQHYQDNSRVINSEKYEEYKLKEKFANEKEKSSSSKKSLEQSSSKSKESTKTNDKYNGRSEVKRINQTKSNSRNSSSDNEDRGFKSEKVPSDKNTQRYSSSDEEGRDQQKSRSFKCNSDRARKHSDSEEEKPEKSSNTKCEHNARRSRSNSVDRKGARDYRKDGRNTLHSKSRNRSLSAEDITGSRRRDDKGQSGRNVKEYSSSEEARTEEKSQNKGKPVRKTRNSSTSSEDSRTRRKAKSKNSHKSRERGSGSESLSSTSSNEPKRSKKSKKKTRSGTPVGKRDIDKKRKGKKKRRDRDRSPNYKKHKR